MLVEVGSRWPGGRAHLVLARAVGARAAPSSSCRPAPSGRTPTAPRRSAWLGLRRPVASTPQREALEGVLGITTSVAEQVDEAGLTSLLPPYAPIHVVARRPGRSTRTAAGRERGAVSGRSGRSRPRPQAAHLLVAHGPNESEIARLPRIAGHLDGGAGGAGTAGGYDDQRRRPGRLDDESPATGAGTASAAGRRRHRVRRRSPVAQTLPVTAGARPGRPTPTASISSRPTTAGQKLLTGPSSCRAPSRRPTTTSASASSTPPAIPTCCTPRSVPARLRRCQRGDRERPRRHDATDRHRVPGRQPPEPRRRTTYRSWVRPTVRPSDDRIDGIDATIVLGKDFAAFVAPGHADTVHDDLDAGRRRRAPRPRPPRRRSHHLCDDHQAHRPRRRARVGHHRRRRRRRQAGHSTPSCWRSGAVLAITDFFVITSASNSSPGPHHRRRDREEAEGGRRPRPYGRRVAPTSRGCCSTTATSSCTCSSTRPAASTTSSGCTATCPVIDWRGAEVR